jgi:phosphate transport system ATP-binding protein
MNDLIETARVEGTLLYHGVDLYDEAVDPVEVRRRIGMVFQKPNPFPKSIYDNIAFGPRIAGFKGNMDELVEESLRRAALWDEVKGKLKESGLALSGGQQQRLCIARAIAVEPVSGEVHLRHPISPNGYYRGKKVVKTKADE